MSPTRTRKTPAASAARRRNLACRRLALGRHHGAHESLLSLARVMGPPDCQGDGTTVARY